MIVDFNNGTANVGDGQGHALSEIESVIGSNYADLIIGDANANNLEGGAGNDTLIGGGGGDWITPGAGNDVVDGGSGSDMVSLFDLSQGAIINLETGIVRSGQDTKLISNVENITGTIHGDFIQGDESDNRLRGLGHYDWFVGSGGSDSYDGGTGRDMVSYVYSDTGVTADLGTGRGMAGQAAGDTYIGIERLTGSIGSRSAAPGHRAAVMSRYGSHAFGPVRAADTATRAGRMYRT